MDVPAVVERLATGAEASAELQALGWQGGVYRQFTCKPPAGRVGWVDISVHRFPDAASAAEAVAYFAASRADSMDLQSVPAPDDRRQQRRADRSRGQWHGILALHEWRAVALRRHRGRAR